jgi:aldose 1-epimerase
MAKISQNTVMSPIGDITLFTITNKVGASVKLSSLGACIAEVNVPDKSGKMADVVIGYANPADYLADGPCAGKVPGRYANRIAKGHFSIDGKEYTLAINNGPNALHGGPTGFQNRIWQAEATADAVIFTYKSADGEEGYPGNVTVKATYTWSDDCELTLAFHAVCDSKTVINLTNHSYFNLAGHDTGSALDHELWLACSSYLPTDDTLIPTGEIAPVAGTPMDFTKAHAVGRDIKADFPTLNYGKGYDNCWVVDNYKPGEIKTVARLTDNKSGRVLEVATDQPAAQVYTGNYLNGSPKSKSGHDYKDYDAIAIECQDMPDAPNHANFPSTLLNPGEEYNRTIIFKFKNI